MSPNPVSSEELIITRWHQCGTSARGADCSEAERGWGFNWPQRAEAASQRSGRSLAGEHQSPESDPCVPLSWCYGQPADPATFGQRHLARTAGRWKDNQRKNALSELQDELMSVRLREAEAQAELRENRQRLLEMETQVRAHTSSLFMHSCFKSQPQQIQSKLQQIQQFKIMFCESFHNDLISWDRYQRVKWKRFHLNFRTLDCKNMYFQYSTFIMEPFFFSVKLINLP